MENQELLDAILRLENRVGELTLQVEKPKERRLKWRSMVSPITDLVIASLPVLPLGGFLARNIQTWGQSPMLSLPALCLFAFAIYFIHVSIRQLILIHEVDYSKPIGETQSALAQLRLFRVQAMQNAFVGGLFAWFAGPLWLLQMAAGPDVLTKFPSFWVSGNLLVSAALVPVIVWAIRRSRWANSIQDELAGKDVLEAEAFLRELREFRSV